jgi:hypothetical protein
LVQSLNLLTPPKLCTFCVLFIRKGLFAAFAFFPRLTNVCLVFLKNATTNLITGTFAVAAC